MAEKKFSRNIINNVNYIVEKIALYYFIKRQYSQFRQEIRAPPASESTNQLILLPMSQYVIHRGPNWTAKNVITGFWYSGMPLNYSPPKELQEYLSKGEKPVFISFGSAGWSEEDGGALLELIVNAVTSIERRAIVVTSGKIQNRGTPNNMFLIDEVPYEWMLNHVSCVVHHCGLGTTAEVLKAGIPSVPVPYIIDQFSWANRIHSLNVAVQPIPRKQLTAKKLSKAITQTLESQEMRNNAKELSEKLQKENGLQKAVDSIEDIIHRIDNNRNL